MRQAPLRLMTIFLLGMFPAACTKYDPTGHASNRAQGEGSSPAVDRDPNTVVATIDGEKLTEADLQNELSSELTRGRSQYLEQLNGLRSQGLERLIDRRLIARKAGPGMTTEEYVEKEVVSKVPDATDAEARGLYDQAAASGRELPPFEQVTAEVKQVIKQRKTDAALEAFQQKLRGEAKIEKSLVPLPLPRVQVDTTGPSRGAGEDAPVTIVEFSDYECPFCGRAEPALKQVLEAYPGKVRLVYKHFPLPNHPSAPKAAEAAICAGDQGKYWEMHDKLFANHENLSVDSLKGYAKELALDPSKFDACLDSGAKAAEVRANQKAGEAAGVGSTPMFFINGRPLSGAQPFEQFQQLIDLELSNKT